jgi:hypothetical protein
MISIFAFSEDRVTSVVTSTTVTCMLTLALIVERELARTLFWMWNGLGKLGTRSVDSALFLTAGATGASPGAERPFVGNRSTATAQKWVRLQRTPGHGRDRFGLKCCRGFPPIRQKEGAWGARNFVGAGGREFIGAVTRRGEPGCTKRQSCTPVASISGSDRQRLVDLSWSGIYHRWTVGLWRLGGSAGPSRKVDAAW